MWAHRVEDECKVHFAEYQAQAVKTRQVAAEQVPDPVIPLLGLAGEAGELLSEYKKLLRDGQAHSLAKERIAEELGDLLWYLADAADVFELDLETIAEGNLEKCRDRWADESHPLAGNFDAAYPEHERFPRRFSVRLENVVEERRTKLRMWSQGVRLGDDLTDNSYEDDGYRFHDVFHLACAAVLGWSPVLRALMKRKRKSCPEVDDVEDGGRAVAIEEGISALVFSYAENHAHLEGVKSLDYNLLRTIRGMTCDLEVAACTSRDWERAILACYQVWRELAAKGGGWVVLDLDARTLQLECPADSRPPAVESTQG
jgi:NTP pyrophosphatase (non-canonical NTP hydrolase)